MTARQITILRHGLKFLDQLDGGMVLETILRAGVPILIQPRVLESELDEFIRRAEREKLIVGVRTRFGEIKWKLSDAGKAALLELEDV